MSGKVSETRETRENDKCLRGVISPMVTPFTGDLTVDEGLYCDFAKHLLSDGCVGLLPFGTTGEAASVSPAARISALRALVQAGVPAERLLFGAGLCDLSGTADLCHEACDLGCRGVLLLPPYYYKSVSDDGLFDYFGRLIDSVRRDNLRIYLYHIPQVCGVGFPLPLVRRLFEAFPGIIVGIKDSSGDEEYLSSLLEIPGLSVYPGSELFLSGALERGAMGCITASANLNSAMIGDFIRLYDSGGSAKELAELFVRVAAFRTGLMSYPLVGALKGLLALSDERWGVICPPLVGCEASDMVRLRDSLGL